MRLIFLIILSVCTSFPSLAQKQKSFQKGYFINNEGIRTECYIDEREWYRDSKSFSYQLPAQGTVAPGSIESVKEFVVGDARYIRFEVDVDNSSSKIDSLKQKMAPEWKRDTLFLSVLVDGKADLMYCKRNNEDRFFFKVDENQLTQLVHKQYITVRTNTQPSRIATNNSYKNQLKNDVNCRRFSDERLKALHYDVGVLIKYFGQQNECWGGEVKTIDAMDRRMLRIRLTPGLSIAHAEGYARSRPHQDYEQNVGFRFGAEFEFLLPFHRKKWALLVEPAWQSYKAGGEVDNKKEVSYHSFELGMGIRHHFYLGKEFSIFLNGAAILDIPVEYLTTFLDERYRLETISISGALGLGASFKRFSMEARYYTTRSSTGEAVIETPQQTIFIPLENDYQKMSIILGFRIF
ncbi:MAG: hypothetical protein WKF87_01845 [Chryseolinea sp.]